MSWLKGTCRTDKGRHRHASGFSGNVESALSSGGTHIIRCTQNGRTLADNSEWRLPYPQQLPRENDTPCSSYQSPPPPTQHTHTRTHRHTHTIYRPSCKSALRKKCKNPSPITMNHHRITAVIIITFFNCLIVRFLAVLRRRYNYYFFFLFIYFGKRSRKGFSAVSYTYRMYIIALFSAGTHARTTTTTTRFMSCFLYS